MTAPSLFRLKLNRGGDQFSQLRHRRSIAEIEIERLRPSVASVMKRTLESTDVELFLDDRPTYLTDISVLTPADQLLHKYILRYTVRVR